ncbi:MAG TPA: hypothetical protein VFZ23_11605 [Pyrinomonadaceae bacterium]
MDRETNDLIARQYLSEKNLSRVEAVDFVAWAVSALERGHDTPKLRMLAAESNAEDYAAMESLFRESLAELGWEMPKKKAALKRHSESIMQSIVDGEMEPYDGCSHLYIISIYLGHPDYLYNWNGLFWEREDLDLETLNEMIIEEARKELGGEATETIKQRFPQLTETEQPPRFWDRVRELLKRP